MNIFKSPWYLGGLESIDPHVAEETGAFGQSYGNRVASRKASPPLGHHRQHPRHAAAAAQPVGQVSQASGCG